MIGPRRFFAVCLLAGAALIVLTVAPLLTARAVPAEVAAGLAVWRAHQCEGCHTLVGQGGAYAPDLTHIFSQRGEAYLREFLVQPGAFHPGQRNMPALGLTRTETDHLLAFLAWLGEDPAAAGWPPRPILVAGGVQPSAGLPASEDALPADPAARGEYWFKRPPAICATCHALEPDVVIVGPSLAGVATRAASRIPGMDAETYLRSSILQPDEFIVPGFRDVMQKNLGDKLSAEQINDIIVFLMTLQ